MSVLPVYRTQIPSSSPLFESSSSEFCASSGGHEREAIEQASSRLAARLERSEYKRSRGKRLHKHRSSSSLLGKTILSDDRSKRKSSAPGKLHFSVAENGCVYYNRISLTFTSNNFLTFLSLHKSFDNFLIYFCSVEINLLSYTSTKRTYYVVTYFRKE